MLKFLKGLQQKKTTEISEKAKKKIFESIRTFHGSTHHTWKTTHCGLLSKFFIALNITMGKRTENPHKLIPECDYPNF